MTGDSAKDGAASGSPGSDCIRDVIRQAVAEAVKRELRGANLIDGPTHLAHHQAMEEFMALAKHAKKTAVGAFIMGVFALMLLGAAAWKG